MKKYLEKFKDDRLIDIISSFDFLEDMIIFTSGYGFDLYHFALKEKDMNYVFSEDMFPHSLMKEISKYESIEEMQIFTKEYCKELVQKALEFKSNQIFEKWFSLPYKERHHLLESSGVPVNKKAKNYRIMNTVEHMSTIISPLGVLTFRKKGVKIATLGNSYRQYYPIDEILNMIPNIRYTKGVLMLIGNLITKVSYGSTAEILNSMGIVITKATVWNLVRDVIAPRIYDLEKERTLSFLLGNKEEMGTDKEKVCTLFIEWDGLWISLDNTKNEESKIGQKREIKLGKSYIGWERRYGTGDKASYRTVGTRYVAGFESPEVLREILKGKISEVFDYAGVKQIIINGDGAKWIFQDYDEDSRVIVQLDLFHIHQNITRSIRDKKLKNKILNCIKEEKFLEIIDLLENYIEVNNKVIDVKMEKKLLDYFINNFYALRRYQRVTYVKLKNNLEARNLGTIEASVRNVIGKRMKMSAWSMEGAKALATMLCLEHENRLDYVLNIALDRKFQLKYEDINLQNFFTKYVNEKNKQHEELGRQANIKILARGKNLPSIINSDINLHKIMMENPEIKKFFPKDYL